MKFSILVPVYNEEKTVINILERLNQTKVDKVQIQQSNICLSAYKKKREFNGSKMFIENFDCKKYKIKTKVDKFSKINIKNEIY